MKQKGMKFIWHSDIMIAVVKGQKVSRRAAEEKKGIDDTSSPGAGNNSRLFFLWFGR